MAQRWPEVHEHQFYLRDRYGVMWFADTQHGTGVVTAVTSQGTISASLSMLRDLRGPVHILQNLGDDILDRLPTIAPKQNLNEAMQVIVARTEGEAKAHA